MHLLSSGVFLALLATLSCVSSYLTTTNRIAARFKAGDRTERRNRFCLSSSEGDESRIEVYVERVIPSQIAANFGSDVLFRPDDENSPEFKEYLRQLLKMQVI